MVARVPMGSRIVKDQGGGSWQFAARELVLDGALTMISLSTEGFYNVGRERTPWRGLS
jgi:hypothetical protein